MTPASLEGQTLGKYQVLEPLGGGGMARVYRAYHPQLDRYVAVKALRPDLVEDAEFLARFQREARSVAALRHPNIVQVFDSDVQDDVYYMVMELLEGDTLKAYLSGYVERGEQIPLREAVRVMLDVLDGLAYAHDEGMIHRDIKPANILLTRRGQAVLADFGIAQIVGATRHTASGAMLGTLHYMAPEQGLKGHADERSDLYSLGIVLYEMLTQHTPFEADTPLALLMKHLNDPLPAPMREGMAVPEPLERILLKVLSKEPADRYQSALEMAEAVRAAAASLEIDLAQTVSFAPPPSREPEPAPAKPFAGVSGSFDGAGVAAAPVDDEMETLREAGKRLLGAVGAVASEAMGKATAALQEAAEKVQDERQGRRGRGGETVVVGAMVDEQDETERTATAEKKRPPERRRGGAAVLGAFWILIIGNLCMLSAAIPTGTWSVYRFGWPIEILLLAWALSAVMHITSSIWLFIPAGLVFGTGMLLVYSQWTGNWEAWGILWLFEVWIAAISIGLPILLHKYRHLSRFLARLLALLMSLASIAMILVIGLRVGLDGLLLDLIGKIVP